MTQTEPDDQYPPEEAQRRFETLIRASRRPPAQRKDVPRKGPESNEKATAAREVAAGRKRAEWRQPYCAVAINPVIVAEVVLSQIAPDRGE